MLLFCFSTNQSLKKTSNLAQIEALVFRFCGFMMLQGTENVFPVGIFAFLQIAKGEDLLIL